MPFALAVFCFFALPVVTAGVLHGGHYKHEERRLDVIEFLQVAKALEVNAFELLSEMDLL